MKTKPLVAVLLGCAVLSLFSADASAMYNPALGAFPQRDPAGYADGSNLYQYTNSNPIASVDPDGLATMSVAVAPGWYEQKMPKAGERGQSRWAVQVASKECKCDEKDGKWYISDITATITLFITLDSSSTGAESLDQVYGHEQRHIKMMQPEVEKQRPAIEAHLNGRQSYAYSSQLECDQYRIPGDDLSAVYINGLVATAAHTGFKHADPNPKSDDEKKGYPKAGTGYTPSEPAGTAKGDGAPVQAGKGTRLNRVGESS